MSLRNHYATCHYTFYPTCHVTKILCLMSNLINTHVAMLNLAVKTSLVASETHNYQQVGAYHTLPYLKVLLNEQFTGYQEGNEMAVDWPFGDLPVMLTPTNTLVTGNFVSIDPPGKKQPFLIF